MTTSKKYNRERMLEVRAEVKRYLHGDNPNKFRNLGEMPETMPDAKRVIIALQDRLELSTEAHRKATNLVREGGENFGILNIMLSMQSQTITRGDDEIQRLEELLDEQTEALNREQVLSRNTYKRVMASEEAHQATQRKLDAAMTTLLTSMEG